jgi:hypothetical protein
MPLGPLALYQSLENIPASGLLKQMGRGTLSSML